VEEGSTQRVVDDLVADERLGWVTSRPKPRDKGRHGRLSDPTGRNASEVRAGLERVDADADPSFARGRRADREAIDASACLVCRGIGHGTSKGDAGNEGDPFGRRSRLQRCFWRRTGRESDRAIVLSKPGNSGEGRALTSGMLSKMARRG